MMRSIFALFFAVQFTVAAQTPQVPHKMQFADMTLTIRDDARREIQKDVDALTASPRHHNIKVERAKTYFPIIEKIFKEENVPDDFKYLVLQESALIPDAVSVSKAVGFWQFKDFTALEMGLRVDKEIDERMNIVSSSRAAARYIKKNNVYFNNWIYALQAYQMGAGAVLRSEKDSKSGEKNIEITSKTYWYVKKYLAHKVAFEEMVNGEGQIRVLSYQNQNKKTLTDLAKEVSVDEAELVAYNKWVRSGTIPDDRVYAVIIPVKGNGADIKLPEDAVLAKAGDASAKKNGESTLASAKKDNRKKINGITAIQVHGGESASQVATRAGVDLSSFLKWNDISVSDQMRDGQYYLLGKKRARAATAYHTVATGDNLWSISQQYGVQVKKLKRYNRLDSDQDLKPGMTLWLSARKPKNSESTAPPSNVIQVDNAQTFAWDVNPSETQATTTTTPAVKTPPATQETIKVTPPPAKTEPVVSIDTTTVVEELIKPVKIQEAVDSSKTLQAQVTVPQPVDTMVQRVPEVIVPERPATHTVQQGETLYSIARQYNLGVMDLVNANNLNLQESIKPGQVLKLSESQSIENSVVTPDKLSEVEHQVKPTDTLYSIARQYGVTIKELMEWNNKKDFALSVGERLKVKQSK
ncbi:LysM peptidoglycan-binding domain-containing protein [Ohtaekwangia kribbensis]|uniref:LysM peptidoglycan-binding domain-containing protein n=1 Tax=Ohtaekwangia kribbensis TaxID=688913 RepID=A0ABW3K0H9_9BACT